MKGFSIKLVELVEFQEIYVGSNDEHAIDTNEQLKYHSILYNSLMNSCYEYAIKRTSVTCDNKQVHLCK